MSTILLFCWLAGFFLLFREQVCGLGIYWVNWWVGGIFLVIECGFGLLVGEFSGRWVDWLLSHWLVFCLIDCLVIRC